MDADGNKVCVDECPGSEGFRVSNRFLAANGAPRCAEDCGDLYEEAGGCVEHCTSGRYRVEKAADGTMSVKKCLGATDECARFV